jgi:hypothetical protein
MKHRFHTRLFSVVIGPIALFGSLAEKPSRREKHPFNPERVVGEPHERTN